MTIRRHLIDILSSEPRTLSSLARELNLSRRDLEFELRHALRSARADRRELEILPASCRACGFVFESTRMRPPQSDQVPLQLAKPSRCPECRASRVREPLIRLTAPQH